MPKKITEAVAEKAKKPAAPKAKKEPKPKAEGSTTGMERDHDVKWNEKKVLLFKTLKALKATSATSAKSAADIVARGDGLNARDVRHYSYHAKAAGLIDIAMVEGVKGYSFYLTTKGQAVDPAKALKEQEAAK